jgi:hypothetical protein
LRGHAGDQHVHPEGEALVAGPVHHDIQIGEQVRVPVARQRGKLIADLGRPLLAHLPGIAVVATEPLLASNTTRVLSDLPRVHSQISAVKGGCA